MSPITRVLLATALFGAGTADAGKRVVVLDFDGPRTLADSGRDAVVRALGSDNDIVAQQRWLDAKSQLSRASHGPKLWRKAASEAGVDAVIEGWVQAENRTKVLTIVVTDASSGHELDHVTVKLGDGFTEASLRSLRKELEDRLTWIEPPSEPRPRRDPHPGEPLRLGDQPASAPAPIGPELPPAEPAAPAPARVATAEPAPTIKLFEPKQTDWLPEQPKRIARPTPRFRIGGGFGYHSRSLTIGAEEDGVTQFAGVPAKSLGVDASFYPFPRDKQNGVLSGVGFSFGVNHSIGNTVTFDDLEEVGDYSINQHGWNAALHYRTPLGAGFAIDGEVGYGRSTYNLEDAPETFEVPNTSYHHLHVGSHVDLSITERASVGFGGKYFHVLESGDLTSVDWYGPGDTSGLSLDANFVVPLPARMYVRGDLSWTRFKTSFDGVGVITEEEGAYEAVDSNVGVNVRVGVEF